MDDARLRAALGYSRFKGPPNVLIFDTQYHMVDDAVDGALELGWQVHRLASPKRGNGSTQFIAALLTALVTYRPDFVLTINHLGFDAEGVLATLLERYDIPIASWFVDHPMPVLGGADNNATSNLQLFCFERTAFAWLQKSGYANPGYLPTASNGKYFRPDRLNPTLMDRYRCQISFAGNSWWYKTRVEPAKGIRKAARAMMARQKIGRSNVAGAFEKMLEKGDRKAFAAAQVVLAEASMASRQRFVKRLQALNPTLIGDEYWKNICPGVKVSPYLDYHTELPSFFAASHVNMNITSEQMPTAVNQRVWDVPAVNGFLLTDAQDDALEIFTDEESMAFYSSLDEAMSKARFYLAHPDVRERIAAKGRAIVEQSHRMTHRMQSMYHAMKLRFG
ncbi:MAG: glycosyltransferase [Deltaproteobacteria bacterium]|nr:glycosyltransferase [Deltaproteobacteria bacterium]